MIARHLRQNVVAYLALVVALSTGSAYAAGLADGSVTSSKLAKNAVTSAKIKKGAVKSADIKDGAVGSADIKDGAVSAIDVAPGLLPEDSTLAAGIIGPFGDPPVTPDNPAVDPFQFVLAAAGDVYLRYSAGLFGLTCTSGEAPMVGLTLDGVTVPGSSVPVALTANARAFEVATVVKAAAGAHTAAINVECGTGTWNQSTRVNLNWTVIGTPA